MALIAEPPIRLHEGRPGHGMRQGKIAYLVCNMGSTGGVTPFLLVTIEKHRLTLGAAARTSLYGRSFFTTVVQHKLISHRFVGPAARTASLILIAIIK